MDGLSEIIGRQLAIRFLFLAIHILQALLRSSNRCDPLKIASAFCGSVTTWMPPPLVSRMARYWSSPPDMGIR